MLQYTQPIKTKCVQKTIWGPKLIVNYSRSSSEEIPLDAKSFPSQVDKPIEMKLKSFLLAAALRKNSNLIRSGSSKQIPLASGATSLTYLRQSKLRAKVQLFS